MGSATTQALAASTEALAAASSVSIDTARELFAAAHAVGESSHLSGALADPAAPAAARQNVVAAVFGGFSQDVQNVLKTVVAERWSNADEPRSSIMRAWMIGMTAALGARIQPTRRPPQKDLEDDPIISARGL